MKLELDADHAGDLLSTLAEIHSWMECQTMEVIQGVNLGEDREGIFEADYEEEIKCWLYYLYLLGNFEGRILAGQYINLADLQVIDDWKERALIP